MKTDESILTSLPFRDKLIKCPGGYRIKCLNCMKSGESPKSAKLYFLTKNKITAYCHKCHYSKSFYGFVSDFFPEYIGSLSKVICEKRKEDLQTQFSTNFLKYNSKPKGINYGFSELMKTEKLDCDRLDRLKISHMAVEYCKKRMIPDKFLKYLYFTKDFSEFAGKYGYDTSKWVKEPRLLIPFWDFNKRITHVQGRSFAKETNQRYITINVIHDEIKLWGRNFIDLKKSIFVTEGPIDGFFLPNCLSTAGSKISDENLLKALNYKDKKQIVFVFDNEPHNQDIRNEMEAKIKSGFSILIWDRDKFKEKDINEMVVNMNSFFRLDYLKSMIYHGPSALVKFLHWY